jgi:hypothetical protein
MVDVLWCSLLLVFASETIVFVFFSISRDSNDGMTKTPLLWYLVRKTEGFSFWNFEQKAGSVVRLV